MDGQKDRKEWARTDLTTKLLKGFFLSSFRPWSSILENERKKKKSRKKRGKEKKREKKKRKKKKKKKET